MSMPPPHIGRVALAVADTDRSVGFYTDVIGLALVERRNGLAHMGAGGHILLELHGQPGARPVRRATGLYHFALLLPSRRDLGNALRHLVQVRGPISGFADHAVSEAIYLTDPDGHGIEIYRDRPREDWVYPDGRFKLTTEPLDYQGVLASADEGEPWQGLPPGTMVGHIHLQVGEIAATERFYGDVIGWDVMTRFGAGATFMSANGYHHHLGANTWAGVGLPPAPPDAARLLWYEVRLPDASALETIAANLDRAQIPFERTPGEVLTNDPSGIRIRLTTA